MVEAMRGINDRRDYIGLGLTTWYKYDAENGVKTSIGTTPDYDAVDNTDICIEIFQDVRTSIEGMFAFGPVDSLVSGAYAAFVSSAPAFWTKASLLTAAVGATDWLTITDNEWVYDRAMEEILLALNQLTKVVVQYGDDNDDADSGALRRHNNILVPPNPPQTTSALFTSSDGSSATFISWPGASGINFHVASSGFGSVAYRIDQAYIQFDTNLQADSRFVSLDVAKIYTRIITSNLPGEFFPSILSTIDAITVVFYIASDWGTLNNSDWDTGGTNIGSVTTSGLSGDGGVTDTDNFSFSTSHINTSGVTFLAVHESSDADRFNNETLNGNEVPTLSSGITGGIDIADVSSFVGRGLQLQITAQFTPN